MHLLSLPCTSVCIYMRRVLVSYSCFYKCHKCRGLKQHIYSYSSAGQKFKMSLSRLKSRCWQGWLQQCWRICFFALFQLLEASCVAWLMAPFFIFKASGLSSTVACIPVLWQLSSLRKLEEGSVQDCLNSRTLNHLSQGTNQRPQVMCGPQVNQWIVNGWVSMGLSTRQALLISPAIASSVSAAPAVIALITLGCDWVPLFHWTSHPVG